MSLLMIRCPRTGWDIWTGIETDDDSLNNVPDSPYFTACSHCGLDHTWWPDEAWLTENALPCALSKRTLAA